MRKRYKVILSLISIGLAIILLSLTIGKELVAGEDPSLFSFAIVNFSGYLFFLLLPVESLVPYYQSLGHNPFLLVLIATSTAILAQPINYAIGYLMSGGIIHDLIGEKNFKKMENYINGYGNLVIFMFNVTPLSSAVLSAVSGMLRYQLRHLMLWAFLGLLIKYLVIVFVFSWLFF
jgi:membrane protein YqaA with SNARE-associated domain